MAIGYQQDDDDFASAILGDQAQPMTPMSGTPGSPFGSPSTSGPTGQNLPASPQPTGPRNQPAAQPQTNALAQGDDAYNAIFGAGLDQPQAPAGAAPAAPATKTPGGGAAAPDESIGRYHDQLRRISQTTDPATRAREQDSLARGLFDSLRTAGRDVKWDGDVMVVDGRRYTIGAGQPAGQAAGQAADPIFGAIAAGGPGWTPPPNPTGGYDGSGINPGPLPELQPDGTYSTPDPNANLFVDEQAAANTAGWNTEGYATPGYTAQDHGGVMPGWDNTNWNDPTMQTPKYVVGRILSKYPTSPQGAQAALAEIQKAYPGATFDGKDKLTIPGVGTTDILQNATANGGTAWQWPDAGAGAGGAGAPGVVGVGAPGAQGVGLGGPPAAMPGAAPGAAPAPGPAAAPEFLTDDAAYVPGEIGMDDIPDVDANAILGQMGDFTPERYEVGDLGAGAAEDDQEALIQSILQNPESLDAATIARMKVGSRENAAQLEQQDQDELTAMAHEGGFAGSPWVASQRLTRRGMTNEQIQRGEREVDIEAARTNSADRRAAAGVGSAHLSEVGSRKRGNEALRQGGAKLNADNAFNAASLKSNNVAQATKLSLDAASERGDRMALRESVQQAATELGISRDKLMLDYVTSQMDDMTQRLGIDVQAMLGREGFQVDREKLAQAGREFHEELAFKLRQLSQQYDTDMSGIGLGYAKLENDAYLGELGAMGDAIFG